MPKYRRSHWPQIAALALLLLLVALRWWFGDELPAPPTGGAAAGALPTGDYKVTRVVDGDTLLLDGRLRVRLQGIDTPETVKEDSPVEPWGPEASEFTKAFIRDAGGQLHIESDGEPRDQHGRYLAFAWHAERMLNEELVRAGLARAMLRYDYGQSKKDRLRAAQREAQRAARGIWSER